jgi:hypothetical protein
MGTSKGTSKNLNIAVIPANNHKGRAGRERNFIQRG